MLNLDEYLNKYNKKGDVRVKEIEIKNFGELYSDTKAISLEFMLGDENKSAFGYISYPTKRKPKNGYPAVQIIHGGGGTAYYEFTHEYAQKGFIAIALDFTGRKAESIFVRNNVNESSIKATNGVCNFKDEHPWSFYSTLVCKKAIDYLCGENVVDKNNLFAVGLSWGGYLALEFASREDRLKGLSIIYSSAFISEFIPTKNIYFKNFSADDIQAFNKLSDPMSYIKDVKCSVLFNAGTNDDCFSMTSRQKTADTIKGPCFYSLRKFYYHANFYGFEQPETYEFFNLLYRNKKIPQPTVSLREGNIIHVKKFFSDSKLKLLQTTDDLSVNGFFRWTSRCVSAKERIRLKNNCTAFILVEYAKDGTVWSTKTYRLDTHKV